MLKQIRNWFRRSEPPPVPAAVAPPDPAIPIAKVETAPLSLAAILSRLPEDLKRTVAKMPPPEVTVDLPLPTIVKQLPGGSVKMSLASLYRQAPEGTFASIRAGEKRMVEVPLGEIFKRVNLTALKRRDDQRKLEVAEGYDIFGDEENPYAIAPVVPKEEPAPVKRREAAPKAAPAAAQKRSGSLTMPPATLTAPLPAPAKKLAQAAPKAATQPIRPAAPSRLEFIPSVSDSQPPGQAKPEAEAPSDQPPLHLAITELCAKWPEPIRAEAAALNGATVQLPAAEIAAGLARGKVAFRWGQIRAWTNPPPSTPTEASEATELSLPLKVVAPAYLKSSTARAPQKKTSVDETIPELFAGGPNASAAAPAEVDPEIDAEVESFEQEPSPPEETELQETEPTGAEAEIEFQSDDESSPAAMTETAPQPAEDTGHAPGASLPTIGQIFGTPERQDWKPAEIVEHIVRLPKIAGAVVALQEGLVVAHSLPEGMKGDVVAAFLPQIFARLNQYASEMKLGELDDLLFSTHGAHMQIFRIGIIYFAVLGKPGEALPWIELNIISQELAKHATGKAT